MLETWQSQRGTTPQTEINTAIKVSFFLLKKKIEQETGEQEQRQSADFTHAEEEK